MRFEKNSKVYLSNKTETLRIFSCSIGKSGFSSNFSYFRFWEMSNRKESLLKLLSRECCEKITLVFFWIDSSEEFFMICSFCLYSRIMSSSDGIKSIRKRFFSEKVKFYPRITKHIRIWCEPLFVSFKDIMQYLFFILFNKIKSEKRNLQIFCYFLCDRHISACRAAIVVCEVIDHKTCTDIIPLFLEQVCSYG